MTTSPLPRNRICLFVTKSRETVNPIKREDISITDRGILERYFGITEDLPVTISSPLRENDKNPSFSIQEWNGRVVWKDFGTGESGNIVGLLSQLWETDYSDTLKRIKSDIGEPFPRASLIRKYKGKVRLTRNSTLDVKIRDWKDWDREFWESFGIPVEFAEWCNVYPVSHAFFTRENKDGTKDRFTMPLDKYAYAYFEWKDGNRSIKLYQPFSETMKWLSKHDHSVWDLWKQAFLYAEKKSNETLIITSSRKDAMCLWYNLCVPAMALQGEGYLPKPQVMKQVLDRFENVYLWYDNDFTHENDNPGQDNAKKLIELYPKLKNICIPAKMKSKDPSDLYKNKGVFALMNVWNNQK